MMNYHFNYVEVVYRGKKEELSDVYLDLLFCVKKKLEEYHVYKNFYWSILLCVFGSL